MFLWHVSCRFGVYFMVRFSSNENRHLSMQWGELNPWRPNIKEQILLSCPKTFLMKLLGRSYSNIKQIALGDHILNSHDLGDWKTINRTRRNLMLIMFWACEIDVLIKTSQARKLWHSESHDMTNNTKFDLTTAHILLNKFCCFV